MDMMAFMVKQEQLAAAGVSQKRVLQPLLLKLGNPCWQNLTVFLLLLK
jgi:hypothetical protein